MSPIRLKRPAQPEPLNETAASWVLKAEEGALSTADQGRLRDWLKEPAHASAFDDALWALDAVQRHSASSELMAMRRAALARRAEPSPRGASMFRLGWATAAAVVAGVLLITHFSAPFESRPVPVSPTAPAGVQAPAKAGLYRTGIGERSAVILPDGSVATLDTDSQLRIAYSAVERGIYLVKGQALFEVAKHKSLPFRVYAAGQRITAVGTTFDVRIDGSRLQISMTEGVVQVRPIAASSPNGRAPRELTLRAGQALVTAPSQPPAISSVAASQVATWRGGLLVFEDERLGDAVAEINRYTDKPIRIADASIGDYRVTGVFKTSDPAHFATAMSEVFPIEVGRDEAGSPVLQPRH
jgi:transmembrane sensor